MKDNCLFVPEMTRDEMNYTAVAQTKLSTNAIAPIVSNLYMNYSHYLELD